MSSPVPPADFDGAWKEALEALLPEFLALLFPRVHAAIEWTQPVELLDKDLAQPTASAETGVHMVDKLVRVRLIGGADARHLVQIQRDATFPERMFAYSAGLYLQHRQPTVSLAVLGDDQPGWRPARFARGLLSCEVQLSFPTVKLTDYRSRRADLEASENPFVVVVLAHLAAQATRGDAVGGGRRSGRWRAGCTSAATRARRCCVSTGSSTGCWSCRAILPRNSGAPCAPTRRSGQ